MAAEPSAMEQAASRTLRDNLERIDRASEELRQAINDLVTACASNRPANALPPMVRAQATAASISATLDVLWRFVIATVQCAPAVPIEFSSSHDAPIPVPEPIAVAEPAAVVEPIVLAEPAAPVEPAEVLPEPDIAVQPELESEHQTEGTVHSIDISSLDQIDLNPEEPAVEAAEEPKAEVVEEVEKGQAETVEPVTGSEEVFSSAADAMELVSASEHVESSALEAAEVAEPETPPAIEPAPSEPMPSEPVPVAVASEPAPVQDVATEPESQTPVDAQVPVAATVPVAESVSEPVPSDPAPSEELPSEPVAVAAASESVSVQDVATEAEVQAPAESQIEAQVPVAAAPPVTEAVSSEPVAVPVASEAAPVQDVTTVVEVQGPVPVEAPAPTVAQPPVASHKVDLMFGLNALSPEQQELHRRAYRVAKVSMQDIKLLHPEGVVVGYENKDICSRLREDIEKAHKEYDRRFKPIETHPVDYFYDWMVEILAGGNPEALGEYPYPSAVLHH